MKKQTTYTPYNSSWLKFGSCSLLSVGVGISLSPMITQLPWIVYHAHNLYEQYQHNNKLIKTVEIKLEGEKETRIVEMKPNFMDSFNIYNVLGLSACIFGLAKNIMLPQLPEDITKITDILAKVQAIHEFAQKEQPFLSHLQSIPTLVWAVSKGIHLFSSDKAEYNFTDKETGELISVEDIIDSDFLGYIN